VARTLAAATNVRRLRGQADALGEGRFSALFGAEVAVGACLSGTLRRCVHATGPMTDGTGAVSPTTYYAATADAQLDEAQRLLDTHVTSSVDGRCVECGKPGPCPKRETAVVVFSRTLRLPRRQPGATRPEAIGRPSSPGGWFGSR
jgi:hypothetical protein